MFEWLTGGDERRSASDYSNQEWLEALRPPPDEEAVAALRAYIVRGLRAMLRTRVDAGAEEMAEDHAQDALLKILDNLESFRGESKFTTWAQKIAVREALTELRRKRWDDLSIEDLKPEEDGGGFVPAALADEDPTPEEKTSGHLLVEQVHRIIEEVLTHKQRTAVMAVMVRGMPIGVVAREMGSNRNATYKLIYDARQKIKAALEERGIDPDEVLDHL